MSQFLVLLNNLHTYFFSQNEQPQSVERGATQHSGDAVTQDMAMQENVAYVTRHKVDTVTQEVAMQENVAYAESAIQLCPRRTQ